jgi:hypothetical protein
MVFNNFAEGRANKFLFMGRLSWQPLSFQAVRAMSVVDPFADITFLFKR